jgi:DNA modification methylase
MTNRLYYGDNLDVLRGAIASESVDLIYLDPPFNSNANYNILFKSPAGVGADSQIEAFEDSWHWNDKAEGAFHDVMTSGNTDVAELLRAMRGFLKENDMMAYLAMMAVRLIELHRVLKATGSLYLHCDPTASHYLKLLLDGVFGGNFRNEITWKRTSSHSSAKRWGPAHDTILFYSKTDSYVWNDFLQSHDTAHVASKYASKDEYANYMAADLTGAGTRMGDSGKPWKNFDPTKIGRHWAVPRKVPDDRVDLSGWNELSTQGKLDRLDEADLIYWPKKDGGFPRFKRYLTLGTSVQSVITDIPPINSQAQERLGYPTQKPLALLERIINASSNEGDVVLDPFCGCGTAVDAAQKLGRQWIGIDVTHLSIGLIERRLQDRYGPNVLAKQPGRPPRHGEVLSLMKSSVRPMTPTAR